MNAPKKIADRMAAAMRQLKPIIEQQKSRDVSEADTVTIVKDVLNDALGYNKYTELTGEHSIRGTFCDLVVKLDDKMVMIIEVKAIGVTLDDRHVKQAVDYASNQGVEWVVLTNGQIWRMYRVVFAKPIDKHLLCEVDVLNVDPKKSEAVDCLYPFTKEAMTKGVPQALLNRQQATSRFMIAALLLHNDNLRNTIRRELRRVVDVTVNDDEVEKMLREEVIKRDAMDGKAFEDAVKVVNAKEGRMLRVVQVAKNGGDAADAVVKAAEE